ncbi:MAG TPA: ABC transporter substrate-binding protein [Solirubrobacterales bacterium]|nr:ABC transporter substrate-binding protein [Solirubrobacterales bacterium]
MPPPSSGSRPSLAAIAITAALALAGHGCASPGSGIQSGEHVTVYVSMPLSGAEAANGRDVTDGARLALAEARRRVGDLAVHAVYLDDTGAGGGRPRWSPAAAAANARRATEDSTAIAYLGDFDSGATRFSLPVTNEARMLQVSPASSAVDLVQPFLGAGDQVPDVQHTGERTFGRVIPSDEVQAQAGAVWAKRLHAKDVIAVGDGSSFAHTVGAAFRAEARALGLMTGRSRLPGPEAKCGVTASLGDALKTTYYAGERSPTLGQVSCALAPGANSHVFSTDAVLRSRALRSISARARAAYVTSAAQDPRQLPARGQDLMRRFAARYGRRPGRYAAYGYEAMAVILDSIRRAGDSGDDRDAVVRSFFDTTDRHSVLGRYSIDEVGNTTLNRLTGYRVRDGRPVFDTPITVP